MWRHMWPLTRSDWETWSEGCEFAKKRYAELQEAYKSVTQSLDDLRSKRSDQNTSISLAKRTPKDDNDFAAMIWNRMIKNLTDEDSTRFSFMFLVPDDQIVAAVRKYGEPDGPDAASAMPLLYDRLREGGSGTLRFPLSEEYTEEAQTLMAAALETKEPRPTLVSIFALTVIVMMLQGGTCRIHHIPRLPRVYWSYD